MAAAVDANVCGAVEAVARMEAAAVVVAGNTIHSYRTAGNVSISVSVGYHLHLTTKHEVSNHFFMVQFL